MEQTTMNERAAVALPSNAKKANNYACALAAVQKTIVSRERSRTRGDSKTTPSAQACISGDTGGAARIAGGRWPTVSFTTFILLKTLTLFSMKSDLATSLENNSSNHNNTKLGTPQLFIYLYLFLIIHICNCVCARHLLHYVLYGNYFMGCS